MGVTPESVSRWENEREQMGAVADRVDAWQRQRAQWPDEGFASSRRVVGWRAEPVAA